MRFEHDIYDIDVYSLCESVYYSCNNDEYDYVLECVNNWIYNDYNDNILLEDVMAAPVINSRGTVRDFHLMASPDSEQVGAAGTQDGTAIATGKDFADFEHQVYNSRNEYTTKNVVFTKNGKHFSGRYVDLPRFIKHLPPDLAAAMQKKVGSGTDLQGRRIPLFVGFEYKPNEKGEIPKPLSDIAMARIFLHQTKGQSFDSANGISTVTRFAPVSSVPPPTTIANFDTHRVKFGGELELKTEPIARTGSSPLSYKRNIKQQEPPKQDTPVVTSNNNQSRLSRATTWMKNNKGKTALGVGLGAAVIGGGIYAYKQYKNKPKSVIGKRIAALRGIYHKFMINAQRNPQKANVFKRIAAKILSVIDKLMAFMQHAAG